MYDSVELIGKDGSCNPAASVIVRLAQKCETFDRQHPLGVAYDGETGGLHELFALQPVAA